MGLFLIRLIELDIYNTSQHHVQWGNTGVYIHSCSIQERFFLEKHILYIAIWKF